MDALFEAMMHGTLDPPQTAAVLSLMAARDPDPQELAAAARVMRRHVTAIPVAGDRDRLLDTAGTGGAPKTFNVSTAAAIVAAGGGIPVAKHGNRSRTGRGSAEVLAALGVNIDAGPDIQGACLEQAGVAFCFAIHHHPATRFVVPVRRSLAFPTIFNLLGPLTNPGGARRQLLGVWDQRFGRLMAEALLQLGAIRGIVAHAADGLDEISISAPTTLWHVEEGGIREEVIAPDMVGLPVHPIESVTAGDLDDAAAMVQLVLDGSDQGPARDMVLINAAAAMLAGGGVDDLQEGVERARSVIDDGLAVRTLQLLADVSQSTDV
jgi:anthranilate phosphoribosyltransferase